MRNKKYLDRKCTVHDVVAKVASAFCVETSEPVEKEKPILWPPEVKEPPKVTETPKPQPKLPSHILLKKLFPEITNCETFDLDGYLTEKTENTEQCATSCIEYLLQLWNTGANYRDLVLSDMDTELSHRIGLRTLAKH